MNEFTVGQKVLYRGAWGTNNPRLCTITGVGTKNGRVVYDNDLGKWGYAHQYQPISQRHDNGADNVSAL